MDYSKVSVVIPSYNHGRYLAGTIQSVLEQTRPFAEIVIVDDGSRDDSVRLCRELQQRHPLIRLFIQKNEGAHNAINRGIREARGDLIAVLNSDDLFLPDKIERCLEILAANPGAELVAGRVEIMNTEGVVQSAGVAVDWQKRALDYFRRSGDLSLSLLNENFIATTSNMLFTKRLWEESGGFQPLRYCHDLDFLLAAALKGKAYFDEKAVHIRYRVHPGNTIAEDLSKIRVEIAAVTAVYLMEGRQSLFAQGAPKQVRLFKEFLRNKNFSDLLTGLMPVYLASGDRRRFYENVYQKEFKEKLTCLLG